jgi:hypothetical protein
MIKIEKLAFYTNTDKTKQDLSDSRNQNSKSTSPLKLDLSGQQNHTTSLYILDKNHPINNERLI